MSTAPTPAPEGTTLSITRPDDWHLHLRDGAALAAVAPMSARQMGRAIVMPNLKPPVATLADALAYRERILAALPEQTSARFTPLMTLYLTESLTAAEVERARAAGILAAKLYPAGATTNSDHGISSLHAIYPALEAMQRVGMALLVHGEVTDPSVDLFDREAVFIERHMLALRRDFPELKIVMEHLTTREAVDYVLSQNPKYQAATITPQHLLLNRNAIFTGGIRPHYYCLPVLKRETHRQALLAAATSGDTRFFLGTDSAPHAAHLKEAATGCAGCFSAHAAIELYAEAFDSVGKIHQLEPFAAHHGADFYGLPRNTDRIRLVKHAWAPPESFDYGSGGARLVPLLAGSALQWKMLDDEDV